MNKTALYRHFSQDGELLYIGISLSAVQRLKQHKADKGWAGEIASVHIDYFPTRAAALEAERNAITREKPLFNKAFNQGRSTLVYESKLKSDGGWAVVRVLGAENAVGTIIEWEAGNTKRRGKVLRQRDFLGMPRIDVQVLRNNGTYGLTCVVAPEANPLIVDRPATMGEGNP